MLINTQTSDGKLDVDLDKAAALLVQYGMFPANSGKIALMLLITETVEEFEAEMRKRHLGADLEQCLLPAFRGLYARNAGIAAEVHRELGELGVSGDLMPLYFLNMGNQSYVKLWRDHGRDQPKGWANEFIAGARLAMFKHLRGAIVSYGLVKPKEPVG